MPLVERLKTRAGQLESEAKALYLAFRDPRTPWYARVWLALVLGYLASPLDLIPDFIPVLGHLDDLILVPAGLALAIKMIPKDVLEDCRRRAADAGAGRGHLLRRPLTVALASALALAAAAVLMAYSCLPRDERPQTPPETVPGSATGSSARDSILTTGFRFDLVCCRPDAPVLLAVLARDGIRIIDVDSVTSPAAATLRVRIPRDRFFHMFRPKMVTRRVARSSGDGCCEQEYLDGYTIPEKYRPFVAEVRLPDPQLE